MSIEGQGHFFTIYIFQVSYVLCFTRPRYQVRVYRTIGPLVFASYDIFHQIVKCNLDLFVKVVTITGIFVMYSNKIMITFNHKNQQLQNNFQIVKNSIDHK